ncbi:glycoside hydrolase family 10 protein [Flavihumibacter petaseus]|uniref:Glycosyl hydrolase-like 10 domain-containing protein n=1 Tax=Flavihumibacter petaseus NBRC 106054 TaxID=1220578 RepID=A0A0E9MZ34_9BACT|nr:family 10 glycosylhydrolase [Flavihumibacter petaseus]GAO42808.1 hypothetical protein FPE01S_01_18260 [Flavihumibacter petaseus NBRC 106054]
MKKTACTLALICTFFHFASAQMQDTIPSPAPSAVVEMAPAEFRAVWIATVDNIDWPDRGTTDPAQQRAQYIKLLDMHVRNGMNAVIVQIRPAADAFYPSPYEPWSEWLTGRQGRPPAPYYDPLQFMIAEAHARKLEFHAWLNPYRAIFNLKQTLPAADHVTRANPEWFLNYGDKKYFDPGNKAAQQFVVKVVQDIVKRYDVDAIHFDDYFYPYRIAGKEFPDGRSYIAYGAGMTRADWRRSNVDSIIVQLSRAIKQEKPWVKFGISPFGIWRNKDQDSLGSNTRGGQTNYDDLYADILLWLREGWIDYVAPQIYFEFGHKAADYATLLKWWSEHSYGRHCYIGLGIYKANVNAAWKDKTQLPRQVRASRETPNVQGQIYFSSKSFVNNPNGWSDSLRLDLYRLPAPIPEMPWLPKPPGTKPNNAPGISAN